MRYLFDLFLNLDVHLGAIISQYGVWTYAIVFVVLFCETGLVVTPILPGDSLLFALGAFAARGDINLWILAAVLFSAVTLGDNVNYWVGRKVERVLSSGKTVRWLNQEHLHQTQEFYKRHGGKTIIMARFVPIVRTFAPFVAGIGKMPYLQFFSYSIVGVVLWVVVAVGAGYFFGNIPFVQEHFSLAAIAVVIISLLPGVWHYWKAKHRWHC